ncbi:MAG: CAP domain-containing protein [Patescibacteria group bacterium]|jgi:uncharacterized protein YkwD
MAKKKQKINFIKVRNLTSPAPEKDSDADGIPDSLEEELGTDPFNADTDGDGLRDYEEAFVYGTNPNNPDTDGDGIPDGREVKAGTNPLGAGPLKNFFIPHEGNNYLPRALHSRRLAFWAASAVTVKIITVVFFISFPLSAWLTPDILVEEGRKIIELTNKIRAGLALPGLSESSILNQAAYAKAEDMLVKQYFSHTGPDNRKLSDWLSGVKYGFSVAGENLAMGFSSAEEVVNAWVASKTHYANIIDRDFTEIGVGMAAGRYEEYETTFVAQYFGATAAQSQPVREEEKDALPVLPVPKSEKKPVPKVASENIVPAKPAPKHSGDVLIKPAESAPAPTPPPAPSILQPTETYGNKKNTGFEIFSPGSERLKLYDNGVEIYSAAKNADEDYVKFTLELGEGPHKLLAVAEKSGLTASSAEKSLFIDLTPPVIDGGRTFLTVDSPAGKNEKVVIAAAYLSPDTARAEITFLNNKISLTKDPDDPNKWTGSLLIFGGDEKNIFDPVVPATLTATDYAGSTVSEDINWKNITPAKTSLLDQYSFLKTHQGAGISRIFSFNSIYYSLLIIIASISLILKIFINIKKQHPHVIFKTLSLIALLAVLLII